MPAYVSDHVSSTGYCWSNVMCHECQAILNSGHQYPPRHRHFAQALADEHNAKFHPPKKDEDSP